MRNADWRAITTTALGGFFGFRAGQHPQGLTAAGYAAVLFIALACVQAVWRSVVLALRGSAGGAS